MKKVLVLIVFMSSMSMMAQTKSELLKHFEAYYQQMKSQGDIQGVINAMTHLNVLEPSQQRLDTLAYIYVSEGRNLEALNTIGIDNNATDSNINTEVKALALKALNQPKRALVFYEVLFKKQPNAYLAYEIADLKIQTNDLAGAKASVDYGLSNVKEGMKKAYYETQRPYEVPMKAALTYLKALVVYNMNQNDNLDQAIGLIDESIKLSPNFNLANLTKEALLAKKNPKKE
ncbi:tetratricopeptide repeat protein [Psychroserpens sp. XS_ASV72]|uniref:tetratricopeptide repeat protein n=1 Tax=Psychroserpens sp. XS_ASV72 TaxID=3241293 RepID=UPI0035146D60